MTNSIKDKQKEQRLELLNKRFDKLILELAANELERDIQIGKLSLTEKNSPDKNLSNIIKTKQETFEQAISSLKLELEVVVDLIKAESN